MSDPKSGLSQHAFACSVPWYGSLEIPWVSFHYSDTSDPASTDSRLLGRWEFQEEIKGAGLMRRGPDLLHKAAKTSARCLTTTATLNQLKSRLDSRSGEGFYAVVKSGILTTERRGVYEACLPNPISLHAFHLFNHNRGLENYMHVWNLVTGLLVLCLSLFFSKRMAPLPQEGICHPSVSRASLFALFLAPCWAASSFLMVSLLVCAHVSQVSLSLIPSWHHTPLHLPF